MAGRGGTLVGSMPRPATELTKEQLATFRGRFVVHLKALMAKAGVSKEKLAEKVGIGEPSVRKWFRLEATPDPETMERMARVLGVSDYRLLYPPPVKRSAKRA